MWVVLVLYYRLMFLLNVVFMQYRAENCNASFGCHRSILKYCNKLEMSNCLSYPVGSSHEMLVIDKGYARFSQTFAIQNYCFTFSLLKNEK